MGICADNNKEKEFYAVIHGMIGELAGGSQFSAVLVQKLKEAYRAMEEEQQNSCLLTVYKIMEDDYAAAIYFMAVLLRETGDKKVIRYVIRLLSSKRYPLWERMNDASQFRFFLFTGGIWNEYKEYRNMQHMYEGMLKELGGAMDCRYPVQPFEMRRKKVILVVSQMINRYHAPTGYVIEICRCLARMGYEAECYICHYFGVEGYWDWNKSFFSQNMMHKTGPFIREFADAEVKGYNFELRGSDYIETLKLAADMVYKERPEYVLEIGSETILAGLCREFTTVVTMGLTGRVPVTNAQLIAVLEEAPDEEALWDALMENGQTVLPVRFAMYDFDGKTAVPKYRKTDFGIPDENFVIVIAGNRLDLEIKEAFEQILFQMLDLEERFTIAVIGECPVFQKRMTEGSRAGRFCFLGHQSDFKSAVGIGDVFVNPPRQGGGTGGLFAMMEEVPVVTLGGCDVAAVSGDAFACDSLEDMPALVRRYFTDREFMHVQKENCRRAAEANLNVDNGEAFQRIHDAVKKLSS